MPRQARIDAPGALHHIIVRGIERKAIFRDHRDRDHFLDRLDTILTETSTPCYAWALLPNHAHLLLRTGLAPLATVMRRLLTGYAQQFNRWHRRHGQLFQNRYKSILCEEEPYLLELVRYIHLNPLRAGFVNDLSTLTTYPYCGHGVLMARFEAGWQDTDYVLGFFGRSLKSARKSYQEFVAGGVSEGRRRDLMGGGLLRSSGGWRALREFSKVGVRIKGDERILGSSEFVEKALKEAEEVFERKTKLRAEGLDLDTLAQRVAVFCEISPRDLKTSSKDRSISHARAILCHLAVNDLAVSGAEVARALNITPSTVSKSAKRGKSAPDLEDIRKRILGI